MIKSMALHSTSLSVDRCIWPVSTRAHPVYAMSCRFRVQFRFVPTLVYNDDDIDDGGGGSESDTLLNYRNKSVLFQTVARLFQLPSNLKCR